MINPAMTTLDQIKMERLISMRDWRLRENRTFHHESEAIALQWAINVINECLSNTDTNGGTNVSTNTTQK